jgi:hypothetical protein
MSLCCSCRYCLLSRSSYRVSESQLAQASPEEYATMSDDLVMVHAAVQLGHKVRWDFQDASGMRLYGF